MSLRHFQKVFSATVVLSVTPDLAYASDPSGMAVFVAVGIAWLSIPVALLVSVFSKTKLGYAVLLVVSLPNWFIGMNVGRFLIRSGSGDVWTTLVFALTYLVLIVPFIILRARLSKAEKQRSLENVP